MITSKPTSKAQTTVLQTVRVALGAGEGDEVAYTIEAERVILRKAPKLRVSKPAEDPFGTFTEWDSEANHLAFANL